LTSIVKQMYVRKLTAVEHNKIEV